MTENLKNFLQKASEDRAWLDELNSLDDRDAVISKTLNRAKELGIMLSAEDFEQRQGELSEDELNVVSGGGTCACVLGGGGTEGAYGVDKTCACVLTGAGLDCDGLLRCFCEVGGGGKAFL